MGGEGEEGVVRGWGGATIWRPDLAWQPGITLWEIGPPVQLMISDPGRSHVNVKAMENFSIKGPIRDFHRYRK